MKRLIPLAAIAAVLVQGCATSTPAVDEANAGVMAVQAQPYTGTNEVTAVALGQLHGAAIGVEKNAPLVDGHPLTSVVVTQCNLVVAVYMTMPDGRLLRFDKSADVPAEQLVDMAYTATRSERVEVSCDGTGVAGYETHNPV